jgi:3-phosphoshikimate 1-carboxyvinyltransferase
MMSLKVKKGKLPSVIKIPGSKSYANRMLILAALRPTAFTLHNVPAASDVSWLIKCLKQIGLSIVRDEDSLTVQNSFPACEREGETLEVGEGGTTARFLAALLLRGQKPYTLILGKRLSQRPWNEFIDFVNLNGGEARLSGNELYLKGALQLPDEVEVDCSRTTQFASGLSLAFHQTTRVKPLHMNSSQSYWELTAQNISYVENHDNYNIPLDWSSASYPLAFAALNHEVRFPGLVYDEFQADVKFLSLLKSLDAAKVSRDGLIISPIKKHQSIEMDVSDSLDLVPALAYFLAHVPGRHKLIGIGNLVHKESDRLSEVIKLLTTFERETKVEEDSLHIQGEEKIIESSKDLILPDDHRMVMSAAMFLRHHSGGSLTPYQAVEKSYPNFFEIFAY